MVSNDSLRPVYTFLYTIINGDVIASVVQKKKSFEISWPQKNLFCVRTQPCTQTCAFGLTPLCPPPLCVRTMWMTPVQLKQLLILKENVF